jgi:hypothetical protein
VRKFVDSTGKVGRSGLGLGLRLKRRRGSSVETSEQIKKVLVSKKKGAKIKKTSDNAK